MAHRNARLTPVTRAELVERVTDGWPQAEVARLFRVSRATVAKWVRRFREGRTGRALRPLQPSPAQPPPDRSVAGSSHLRCTPVFRLGATPHRVAVGHRPLHRLRRPAPRRTPPPRVAPSHHTGRSCATSMPARARWFTSTSRNSVASRRVAASASCPASPRPTAVLSAAPASVSISSMWPWTTIPATPTSRPCRTNAARLLLPSSSGRWPTSGARASPSSAS